MAASINLGMAATAERADPAAADHSRLVYLARLVAQEVKTDIIIHDAVKSLQFVKMPCITVSRRRPKPGRRPCVALGHAARASQDSAARGLRRNYGRKAATTSVGLSDW